MRVCKTMEDWAEVRQQVWGKLGFVPTMGALHAGHLSLVDLARQHADLVAASVFVNPTQFNDPADFEKYPRTLEDDLQQLEAAGVDLVFAPSAADMYPPGELPVVVDVPALTHQLEGAHRPGHFAGVCRVVLKLFNLVRPDVAVFGMKDFQQLRVIEAMTAGLNLPIRIVRGPTLREPDGLAMSSRNRRLPADERQQALAISRGLTTAEAAWRDGARDPAKLTSLVEDSLRAAGIDSIDYIAAVDAATLEPVGQANSNTLLAVAAQVGPVRLIDNRILS